MEYNTLLGHGDKSMKLLQWKKKRKRMKGFPFVHLSVIEASSKFIPYSQRAHAY